MKTRMMGLMMGLIRRVGTSASDASIEVRHGSFFVSPEALPTPKCLTRSEHQIDWCLYILPRRLRD